MLCHVLPMRDQSRTLIVPLSGRPVTNFDLVVPMFSIRILLDPVPVLPT